MNISWVLATLALFSCNTQPPSQPRPQQESRVESWQADLRALAQELPARHVNAFHRMSRDEFNRAVQDLDRRIPSLADHEVIIGMQQIMASVGDGHTWLDLGQPGVAFPALPIRLFQFTDGLFVIAATSEYASAIGARVLAVGSVDANQAYEAVRSTISRDNDQGVKTWAPLALTTPQLLRALRLSDSPLRASYLLEDSTGRRFTVEVSLLGPGANPQWVFARDTSPSASPLYLRNQGDFYWYVYEPGSQVLYLQYNRSLNKPSQSFAQFSQELFAFADANPISRFIVDIRLNNGGDFSVNRPLIEGLRARPALTQPGRLFVIIGRRTFSAAMMCAVDLLTNFDAVFVGEPTGGNTNHYGDNRPFTLPNSGIAINYATVFHQLTEPRTQEQPLQPQILAELSFADYRANRDPAREAISRARTPEQGESELGWFGSARPRGNLIVPRVRSSGTWTVRRTGAK